MPVSRLLCATCAFTLLGAPASCDDPGCAILEDAAQVRLPPGHRAYTSFEVVWRAGLDAGAYRWGRTATRLQLARHLGATLARARQRTTPLSGAVRHHLGILIGEFSSELQALGVPRQIPPPLPDRPRPDRPVRPAQERTRPGPRGPVPPPVRIKGTSTTRITFTEKEASVKVTSLIDLEIQTDFARVVANGTYENKGNAGLTRGNFDVFIENDRHTFDANEFFVELFAHLEARKQFYVKGKAGDLRNVTLDEGLTVGSKTFFGYDVLATFREKVGVRLIAAKTEDNDEDVRIAQVFFSLVKALDLKEKWLEELAASGNFAHFDEPDVQRFHVAGGSITLKTVYASVYAEIAVKQGSGQGIYLKGESNVYKPLTLKGEVRLYRKFVFDFNNAPIYSGISGGNDEDEKGVRGRAVYSPIKALEFTLGFDQSRPQEDPRTLRDYLAKVEVRPLPRTTLSASIEYEEDERTPNRSRLVTFGASRSFASGTHVRGEYQKDRDLQDLTETVRVEVSHPLFEKRVELRLSETYRRNASEGKENELQAAFSWRVTDALSLSVRYTYNDDDEKEDALELTVTVKW